MILRLIVSLIGVSFVLFPLRTSATLFVQGDIDATCQEVCEYKGYRCDKRAFKHMNCRDEVSSLCKHTAGDPSDHTLRCQIGGCYGQCGGTSNTVYYDLDTQNDYCTRASSCLQRGYGRFFQVCPCNKDLLRSDGGDGSESSMPAWKVVGVSFTCIIAATFLVMYLVKMYRKYQRTRYIYYSSTLRCTNIFIAGESLSL